MGKKRVKARKKPYSWVLVERVGAVSIYKRNRIYYVYYRDNGQSRRIAVSSSLNATRRTAGQVNAELQDSKPTILSYHTTTIPDSAAFFLAEQRRLPLTAAADPAAGAALMLLQRRITIAVTHICWARFRREQRSNSLTVPQCTGQIDVGYLHPLMNHRKQFRKPPV